MYLARSKCDEGGKGGELDAAGGGGEGSMEQKKR